ncbi:MAG: tRNA (adenosine(37)-N6)-threonylcarbamoyltransferase complex dimerization subunit type 1 TsaB [bacterium]|nr:tRNA (adenosine(37)-N6)-threonylcarbamoyltransferase complex dimerization subunit type 1 TsaB [bacterium]
MLILGIESASDQSGCALATENGILAEARLALPRRHAEALAPQMRFVCEQAGIALADIDAVAVDQGPGLYTGLRAGLATAKATAAALGIGLVPVGSLEALAFGAAAAAQPGETVLSVLDARRGEVFWAWYRIAAARPRPGESRFARSRPGESQFGDSAAGSPAGDPSRRFSAPGVRLVQLSAPQVGPPEDLLPALSSPGEQPSGRTVVVGDGALRYADLLATGNAAIACPALRFPSPAAVALLGRERALTGGAVAPEQVGAVYLRSPDAQPQPSSGPPDP